MDECLIKKKSVKSYDVISSFDLVLWLLLVSLFHGYVNILGFAFHSIYIFL